MILSLPSIAQKDSTLCFLKPAAAYHPQRFYGLAVSELALATGSLIGLNELWYKNYPRSGFHFFKDAREWAQMDKAGHCVTAYFIGSLGHDLLLWSGINATKSIWFGGLLGFTYQNAIEVLDGFSTQWGFSATDFAANAFGAGAFVAQQLLRKQQRIIFKYSYHTTAYPQFRPKLLGERLSETWLKDYNGQTYWLSLNIASFLKADTRLPSWLNVAFGYGAEGMLGARVNPLTDANGLPYPHFKRYRKLHLSLDIDLKRIKTKSQLLKTLFAAFNLIKIPAPALELNPSGIRGHLLYF